MSAPAPGEPTDLRSALRDHYGITVAGLRPHPGGFEAECWVAGGEWFVKVWHRRTAPSGLESVRRLATAGVPVPTPVPTVHGGLFAWWAGRPYVVYPFVRGRTATGADWRRTAQALRRVHRVRGIDLPTSTMDEPEIRRLRRRLDHPWVAARRSEVAASIERLEAATDRARARPVPLVVCHRDFGGDNLLIDDDRVVAVLDWEQAVLGPREHDLWIAAEQADGAAFLAEYGAYDLDRDHVEYALLARALRDMAARVLAEEDRPGVRTWGFDRIARLDRDLAMFAPFCA